jgi:hypothetical protein
MTVLRISLTILVLSLIGIVAFAADNSGRINGKITTVDGDVLEGLIRWDKNEANWVDVLNGSKDLRDSRDRSRRGRRRYDDARKEYSVFGMTISSDGFGYTAQSGIRFGHIRTMHVVDDDVVRLELKSDQEVEMFNGSTDIGTSIREIVIEDDREGEIELSWDDIDRIDFEASRSTEESRFGERLYGVVTTRRGDEFTGFICWDVDELFSEDVLDGEERGRDRRIRFGKIASIERYSSKGATVILKSGDEMVLRGTNDVNSENRGIIVSDPGFGQVIIPWDEFDIVKFGDASRQVSYDKFDGGRPLRGTVYTEDGDEYQGQIRWDDDEEYTWELLDGEYRDLEFDIELGLIRKIEKKSYRASLVTTLDGREFQLRGSNDVDEDNKGIFILLADGDEVEVDWDEFERVEFSSR